MSDSTAGARAHYGAAGLKDRLQSALDVLFPGDQALTVSQLASFDQFHIRGMQATGELADAAGLDETTRVLDVGSGVGGPARYLAAMYDCVVTGVDLSPSFVEAAAYLTQRCGLSDRVRFQVGNALELSFPPESFDAVFLQHVAMNVEDRAALYAGVHRVLAPGGRFVTYDVVLGEGEVLYPVPWARDHASSFLLTEEQTRGALERAGFRTLVWRNDSQPAVEWFQRSIAAPPANNLHLGLVMGPDFREMSANLLRNLSEHRVGVLSAVVVRD